MMMQWLGAALVIVVVGLAFVAGYVLSRRGGRQATPDETLGDAGIVQAFNHQGQNFALTRGQLIGILKVLVTEGCLLGVLDQGLNRFWGQG